MTERDPGRESFPVPPGACDCHAHVVGPFDIFPLSEPRSYTPPERPEGDYLALLSALGMTRGVIVQPSFYRLDNRCTLATASRFPDRFRAVVVVDGDVSERELLEMHAAGARGFRVNSVFTGGITLEQAVRVAHQVADLGWHAQFLMDITELPEAAPTLARLPIPVVFDHMGHFPADRGTNWPGFAALRALAAEREVWVKLSGAYRLHGGPDAVTAAAPVARVLLQDMPDRLVWGSDWPHVGTANPPPRTEGMLEALVDWCDGDRALIGRILVDNPARLYGFPAA